MEGIHILDELSFCFGHSGLQLTVGSLLCGGCGDDAVEILLGHRVRAADQVAEVVGKIHIIAQQHVGIGDTTVLIVGHFGKREVTHAIHTEGLGKLVCVDHIAAGLGHLHVLARGLLSLLLCGVEPRMAKHLLGQRNIQCHEEDGPVDGMEAQNILTDHVHVAGPVLAEFFALLLEGLIGIVADGGDIVCKGIQPYVHHVLGINIHRHTPAEGGTGYAKILQTALYTKEVVDHFLLARLGLNELGVGINVGKELFRIVAHLEEISLLARLLNGTSAVGALTVHDLRFGEEGFTGSAIPALVISLINIALIVKTGEDLAYGLHVIVVGGADKAVVGGVHLIPHALDLACHAVHVKLGGDARFLGKVLDLLAVLVRAGAEEHVKAALALIACNGIRHDHLVGVAKMGLAGCVCDCCCQIILFTHCNSPFGSSVIIIVNSK